MVDKSAYAFHLNANLLAVEFVSTSYISGATQAAALDILYVFSRG